MLKKFYIVKDQKDLYSGGIFPYKVLNYLPAIQPMPITKTPSLSIPLISPSFSPILSPTSVAVKTCHMPSPVIGSPCALGPPIVKLTPMINQNVGGTIKIIGDNFIFNLVIPIKYMRNVVNDIYLMANDNITDPKITFRIITPTLDSSVKTSFSQMIEIIKHISNKYSNITYKYDNGSPISFEDLMRKMLAYLQRRDNTNYVPI